MQRRHAILAFAAPLLGGCARKASADAGKEHKYFLEGTVVRLSPNASLAAIQHGPIRDKEGKTWMEAMTMEFPVKDAADRAKLKSGQQIRATLFQRESDLEYWIGEIEVIKQ